MHGAGPEGPAAVIAARREAALARPTQPPTIPEKHVMTWDSPGPPNGPQAFSKWEPAGQWLTWALADPDYVSRAKAAGILTATYLNPNRQRAGEPMWTNDSSTFAHDCSGARILIEPNPMPDTYLMDPHSTHLRSLWKTAYENLLKAGHAYDADFDDTADEIHKALASPCRWNQTDWTNASNAMNASFAHPIIYNGLMFYTVSDGIHLSPVMALNTTAMGGMAEDCYVSRNTDPFVRTVYWQATEDTEIAQADRDRLFICQSTLYADAAASISLRTYYVASFLLTYRVAYDMEDTSFRTPSELHVMPESQLVVQHPVDTQPSDISKLQTAPGVYARQYDGCYIRGTLIGGCAVVVDSEKETSPLQPFPYPGQYHHTLKITGSGIIDGGAISAAGPAPPAKLGGTQAVIAFP